MLPRLKACSIDHNFAATGARLRRHHDFSVCLSISHPAGVCVGAVPPPGRPRVLHHFDHLLLEPPGVSSPPGPATEPAQPCPRAVRSALRPDAVLQLGGRLTSKRVQAFLEWAAVPDASAGRYVFQFVSCVRLGTSASLLLGAPIMNQSMQAQLQDYRL